MKKLGRPRDDKQVKKAYSVRLEPRIKNRLVKKYRSLANAINALLKKVKE